MVNFRSTIIEIQEAPHSHSDTSTPTPTALPPSTLTPPDYYDDDDDVDELESPNNNSNNNSNNNIISFNKHRDSQPPTPHPALHSHIQAPALPTLDESILAESKIPLAQFGLKNSKSNSKSTSTPTPTSTSTSTLNTYTTQSPKTTTSRSTIYTNKQTMALTMVPHQPHKGEHLRVTHTETLSDSFEMKWGGVRYVSEQSAALRCFAWLSSRASTAQWLLDRALEMKFLQDVKYLAARHLRLRGERAKREHETRAEAFRGLWEVGQKVLRHSKNNQATCLNVLYEWASYALYRESVHGKLRDMGSRAVGQWQLQEVVGARVRNQAQRALQKQIESLGE